MNRCRIARRVASWSPRQNACSDAVNTPSGETKVLHSSVHPFPARGRAAWTANWLAVGDEQRPAGPLGRGAQQAGGVPRAYPRRPSRRVAASAARNTFPYSISGYERKKDMVPE